MRMLPVVLGTLRLPVIRSRVEEPLVEEIKGAVISIAEPPGGFDDLVQHRLQPGRTSDGAQDATDRTLLLAEILELARSVLVVAGRAGHRAQLRRRNRTVIAVMDEESPALTWQKFLE
jgi:hypothetical protein